MRRSGSSRKRKSGEQIQVTCEATSEATCPISISRDDQDSFFANMREMYLNSKLCDVTFRLGSYHFKAHRVVLAAANSFLGRMLSSGMSESEQSVIAVDGVSPQLFKFILDYIYGVKIDIPSSEIIPLLSLANCYSMLRLRDTLGEVLADHLNVANCCSIFAAADAYDCTSLKQKAQELLFSHFAVTSKTASFYDLPLNLIEGILDSDEILDCDEALIFDAAVRWLAQASYSGYDTGIGVTDMVGAKSVMTTAGKGRSSLPADAISSTGRPHPRSRATAALSPSCPSPPGISAATANGGGGAGDQDSLVYRVLSMVRFPLMDSCMLSDVIKLHPIMATADCRALLMEAFEHHALKAAGRAGICGRRAHMRRQSCSFTESTLLSGHQDAVSSLVVYGEWLVSGSWDATIRVWEMVSWQCLRTLSDHAGAIKNLCVCGDKVVSCSDDGDIMVWSPGLWTRARQLQGHDGAVNAVIACRGRLASAGDDGTIKLWNTESWACEVTVHHTASLTAEQQQQGALAAGLNLEGEGNEGIAHVGVMSLGVCGDKLVSGGDDSVVRVWNTNSWTCERLLRAHSDEVWAIQPLADGGLVTGSVDGTLRVWRQQPFSQEEHTGSATGASTSSSSNTTVVSATLSGVNNQGGGVDTDMSMYADSGDHDREREGTWECEQTIHSDGPVYALCCLNGIVVSGGAGTKISVWRPTRDGRGGGGSDSLMLHKWFDTAEVWSLAVCQGMLISGGLDGTVRVWT